jgi:hypothetical protein
LYIIFMRSLPFIITPNVSKFGKKDAFITTTACSFVFEHQSVTRWRISGLQRAQEIEESIRFNAHLAWLLWGSPYISTL